MAAFLAQYATDFAPDCAGCGDDLAGYMVEGDAVTARCACCHRTTSFPAPSGEITARALREAHRAAARREAESTAGAVR